jgi:hypothetical protein
MKDAIINCLNFVGENFFVVFFSLWLIYGTIAVIILTR